MDLSILSAENYYDPKLASGARAPNNRTYPTQYYGGIIVREEEEHNQSGVLGVVDTASEEVTPPKKARRVSHGSDDDSSGRKQRGRPRVDPKDETAADVCSSYRLWDYN